MIVEGKYDKITLQNIVDALIITTNGFSVFKDKEKCALIKDVAEKCGGVIVMSDSDNKSDAEELNSDVSKGDEADTNEVVSQEKDQTSGKEENKPQESGAENLEQAEKVQNNEKKQKNKQKKYKK